MNSVTDSTIQEKDNLKCHFCGLVSDDKKVVDYEPTVDRLGRDTIEPACKDFVACSERRKRNYQDWQRGRNGTGNI